MTLDSGLFFGSPCRSFRSRNALWEIGNKWVLRWLLNVGLKTLSCFRMLFGKLFGELGPAKTRNSKDHKLIKAP